jgi:hypothetical protein
VPVVIGVKVIEVVVWRMVLLVIVDLAFEVGYKKIT